MTETGGESSAEHYHKTNDLIPEGVLRRLAEARRIEAEVGSLTTRLNEISEFKRDPDGKVSAYVHGLLERRAELLKQPLLASGSGSDLRARPVESLIANIGHFFFPWQVLRLPYMSEGINETPGIPGTAGQIATAGLFPGGLGYGGNLSDAGAQQPRTEKWWVHNWTCSAVFPEAPFAARLFYRFTVDSSCLIYRAPSYAGLVAEFVTIGKSPDVIAQSPFEVANLETVGWPVWVTLPQPNSVFIDTASVPVSGSIRVQAGKPAALAFIYGTIVGVADGYVQFSWANFGTRVTLPPSTPYDGEVFDKLEYRFEPAWWVEAVAERIAVSQ
jgi:hypothetical protein